jgi:DNA anti-recombination protein RmuC
MVNPDNTEESNLVRDAASKGVILCSPATIIANMHLVRVAERAMGIAEKTDQILIGHDGMRRAIAELAKAWSTMSSHVNNAQSKRSEVQALMEEVERAMKNLENLDLGDDD